MKGDYLSIEEHLKREKQRARELRKTRWWRRKIERGVCYYCGKRVPPEELTMDHRIPLSRGGLSTRENIVCACKSCNTKKKNLSPLEWEEYLERLKRGEVECAES